MKRSTRFSTAAIILPLLLMGCTPDNNEQTALRKATKVEPVKRIPLKNRESVSCPQEKLYSLRLRRNQKLLWQKPHDNFLNMEGSQHEGSRRLKSDDDRIMPVTSLIPEDEKIKKLIFADCQGNEKVLTRDEIINATDPYFMALNKKGWLKLMYRDEKGRYRTAAKAVTDITLSTHE